MHGRGSWIRTNDLQYPKLPRYQAALYPVYPFGKPRRYTLQVRPARLAMRLSPGVEERMADPVAGLDAVFLRGPRDDLQHPLGPPPRRDDPGRQRLGVFGDPQDPAVGADEDHVERDVGVLHPHRHFLLWGEVEQHPLPVRA